MDPKRFACFVKFSFTVTMYLHRYTSSDVFGAGDAPLLLL